MASSSSSSTQKRKRIDNNNDDQRKRARNVNDEDLSEIVNMVRKNKSIGRGHIQITPELVVEIAQMSRDSNVQKINSKKSTAKRKFNIEDRDIQEIISLIDQNKKNRTSANAFTVERTHIHRRFGYNEYIYDVAIGANKASTLPDFLNNLREVFSYLINLM